MISLDDYFVAAESHRLGRFSDTLRNTLKKRYFQKIHGDLASWEEHLYTLPVVRPDHWNFDSAAIEIGQASDLNPAQHQLLLKGLQGLHPWRKGPFNFFGHLIDTEWRSDWKWDRLIPHISSLKGRTVLDVGCGSGYHCWRMAGAGASFVLGIDPSLKFLYQFYAAKHYLPEAPVFYLPLRSEDLPVNMGCFDTVFSMGVLYHRKSPFEHLEELKAALTPGGELILETLVVPGTAETMLTPLDRYAQMRNVWCIPSAEAAALWLRKIGMMDVRIVDISVTSRDEQRRTDWMKFLSLSDFLDPECPSKTIEGYPAPTRATLVARKPY